MAAIFNRITIARPALLERLSFTRRLQWTPVFDLLRDQKEDTVAVRGWARSVRAQKNVGFIALDDGSSPGLLQVVCSPADAQKYALKSERVVR